MTSTEEDYQTSGPRANPAQQGRQASGGYIKRPGPHEQLLSFVASTPGHSIRDAATFLGWSHARAARQLRHLAGRGLILQVRPGRKVVHFGLPAGNTKDVAFAAFLRDERNARLVRFLESVPLVGMSLNGIAKGAGLSFGYTKRALEQLANIGAVRLDRAGHRFEVVLLFDGHAKRNG